MTITTNPNTLQDLKAEDLKELASVTGDPCVSISQWIEKLIDPAMKAIAHDPEGELETISFQRTWNEM